MRIVIEGEIREHSGGPWIDLYLVHDDTNVIGRRFAFASIPFERRVATTDESSALRAFATTLSRALGSGPRR
jgi:hypothetical protein